MAINFMIPTGKSEYEYDFVSMEIPEDGSLNFFAGYGLHITLRRLERNEPESGKTHRNPFTGAKGDGGPGAKAEEKQTDILPVGNRESEPATPTGDD